MRFRPIFRVSRSNIGTELRRSFSQIHPTPQRPSFGIAFDIDGVILRGQTPIGGSPQALKRLYHDNGTLRIPFLFLTNGGGIPESKRAVELSSLLGVQILPLQVVQGASPFKGLANRFENELVIAIGKGEPAAVMSEYGFKKVLSIDEYASYFEDIDPLSQFKCWVTRQANEKNTSREAQLRYNVYSERVKGAFVVSDPIDWGRDIQVLCDVLRCEGLPGKDIGHQQPPLYFAADDLEYQAAFPSERLGMGAFRIALESIFNSIHSSPLKFTSFGKPNPSVFKNAEAILSQIFSNVYQDQETEDGVKGHQFDTIYMIGDNPAVDINGASKAGHPWFSILTRTGVFRGKDNHAKHPADLVVDTVEEAIDYILKKELSSHYSY
ncbi:uncharacterized protein A4U43_C07F3450 [Asparagus officinalis]|uniref:Uncharacterized protein n=1 Tax=Asparagus officinalis TaxID=4686 RepID=A0A5P1EB18_ASPOF|nr:uncharacterized protein YKR070W [Asparagus officinalis]ONK62397.1 uncharacterized protein A4U43_C07F3450 [Asparagus officinalis]